MPSSSSSGSVLNPVPDDGPPVWCWVNCDDGCGPLENRNAVVSAGSAAGAMASSAGGCSGGGAGGCGSGPVMSSASPVRYWNGAVVLSFADIVTPYTRLTHTRSYNNRTSTDYDGPNGWNWFIAQMPYVVASGTSVAVVFDPNYPIWFDDAGGGTYAQRDGSINLTLVHNVAKKIFTFVRTIGGGGGRGGSTVTTIFNDFTALNRPGQFVSQTDTAGVDTTIVSLSGAEIAELQSVMTVGATSYYGSLVYAYYTSGVSAGKLSSVTYRRKTGSGGSWVNIKQFTYTYHDGSDSNGNLNDLKTATEQQYESGTSSWEDIAVSYYRYYVDTAGGTGFVHGLKIQIGPEGYRRAFNDGVDFDTDSDATLEDYADHYFEYDPSSRMVTKEVAAVCVSCPGGGTTQDTFAYSTSGFSDGENNWKYKTVQTLPNAATLTVYSTYRGTPILHVYTDSNGTDQWYKFWRYNSDFQVVLEAESSAISGYDEAYADLVNYGGSPTYLNASSGLLRTTDYYTTTGSGAAQGYVQYRNVRQGTGGSDIRLREYVYTSNTDSDGNTVYLPSQVSVYPDAATTAVKYTTSYAYTFHASTNLIATRTTTFPVVTTAQNGSNSATTYSETFDANGNLIETTDQAGTVNQYSYDPVLQVATQSVLNYQVSGSGPGINVTTDTTYDDEGRPTQSLGPSHHAVIGGSDTVVRTASWFVYLRSVNPGSGTWDLNQNWSGRGYATGTSPSYTYTLVDPVTISRLDKDGRVIDQITSKRTSGSGALSPSDTFAQTDWKSWSSSQYSDLGRLLSTRSYFLIPSSGTGTSGTNYAQTDYGYDALERRNRVVSPVGTITRTVWTAPQRVKEVWIGTNDTGATDSNPAGSGAPNNMVIVTANQYDGGAAGGDGNLTQVTQYAAASDTRVTSYTYDFRNRRITMDGEVDVYQVLTYDNLDRIIQTDRKDTSSGGNLIGRSTAAYDSLGRAYQQITYAVDPSTGTVGNPLTTSTWYDPVGRVMKQIGAGDGLVATKTAYNAVGWMTATYRSYYTGSPSYSEAGTVSGDIVVEQTEFTQDDAGSVISTASAQRLNDSPDSGTGSAGALTAGTQPKGRISYAASWFDGIGRAVASANYGSIASFTRPGTPPARSDTILVTSTDYDDAGRAYQITDPKAIVAKTVFDAAGRVTSRIDDFGTSKLNRTTNFTYTLDSQIATQVAVNSTTGDQTTTYTYGVSPSTSPASDLASNSLLATIDYPGSVSGSDQLAFTYNRQGQQKTTTDSRGTVHTLGYDKLGRLVSDTVTTTGSGVDAAVLRIDRAYEVRGMLETVTSFSNTSGTGTPVNQVGLEYNDYGLLTKDAQSHSGAVSGSTPAVLYTYAGTSTSNYVRRTKVVGDASTGYDYGATGGINDRLSRVESVFDTNTSGVTAEYTYIGAASAVRLDFAEPQVMLDLWGGTSGTFDGLDLFGRVIDQRWKFYGGTPADFDRYEYGYDRNSNRLWKQNMVATTGFDEQYTVDNLNRLTQMKRGTLNGSHVIPGTPVKEQDWKLDPVGNWSEFVEDTSGTAVLDQTRTASTVNEITSIGTGTVGLPVWATPKYDSAGNMEAFVKPSALTANLTGIYDAWNRLVAVKDGSSFVTEYAYDGLRRRVVKKSYTGGTLTETRDFYFSDQWQVLDEAVGGATVESYAWGVRYVDELLWRFDSTWKRIYAMQDANFNCTAICDSSGNMLERYQFDPYGNRVVLSPSWTVISASAYDWTVAHQGLAFETDIGLYNCRNRVYSPLLAVWLQRDSLGYADGLNLYLNLGSNPIVYTDPSGTIIFIIIGCIAAGCILFGSGCASQPTSPTQPPHRAPDPVIDKSCKSNPLSDCKDNSLVKAALERYYTDCASSSRGALKIVCTDRNSFTCNENTVRYDGSGCGSLAHEIIHAADDCKNDDKCTLFDPGNQEPYCKHEMCTEARATTRASCCDPNNPWRKGKSWAECVEALRNWYLDNGDTIGCKGVSRADRLAAWNKCAPANLTEAKACNGTIPVIGQ